MFDAVPFEMVDILRFCLVASRKHPETLKPLKIYDHSAREEGPVAVEATLGVSLDGGGKSNWAGRTAVDHVHDEKMERGSDLFLVPEDLKGIYNDTGVPFWDEQKLQAGLKARLRLHDGKDIVSHCVAT